jgi:hypothetical protein
MPFATHARIRLANDGASSRDVQVSVTRAPLTRPIANMARFHAKWNRNALQPTRSDRWPDYTVLKTTGRGRFLGFMLHVYKPNNDADPMSAPGDYWWGEGDEKFFVDNDPTPSWYGTGSEDYFGYAWATSDLFARAFHSQVYNEGHIHWKGHRVLTRFQIVDQVPFQNAFEGTIEKYYRDDYARYGVLPFWYLAPGGGDPYRSVPLVDRTSYYPPVAAGDPTRIEGEDLKVLDRSEGSVSSQYMDWATPPGAWSGDQHLFWYKNNLSDVRMGSTAKLRLSVDRNANYRIVAALTRAFDYGTVQFDLDGTACGTPVDLYHDGPIVMGEQDLCARTLATGNHVLTLTITGKNAAAQGYYVGIDYLKLVPN